ncbi:hypothetical protein [Lignipirellula cremea]|nr:hypothetical protein [Lignipirellula cremea]
MSCLRTFFLWRSAAGLLLAVCCVAGLCLATGCQSEPPPTASAPAARPRTTPPASARNTPPNRPAPPVKPSVAKPPRGIEPPANLGLGGSESTQPDTGFGPGRRSPNLGELMDQPGAAPAVAPSKTPRMAIDQAKTASRGIRKISGKHLDLYTDLPASPAIDELTTVFDLAVPKWCAYFDVPAEKAADFRMSGFLMGDANNFRAAGLLPGSLPNFPNGFQQGWEFWVREQEDDYYRRHLLLHEGTHGFMNLMLGGAGPPWYSEGMAELFGTHRWENGQLTMQYNPPDKTETPGWGRVKIIRDETAQQRALSLLDVMRYDSRAHLRVEPYAWCWAACYFLEHYPPTRQAFVDLRAQAADRQGDFTSAFYEKLKPQWPEIDEQWRIYTQGIEYGYDLERALIQHQTGPAREAGAQPQEAVIQADRGWQSTGIMLASNGRYLIESTGSFQIAREPAWKCEPNGVTIHYYEGQPLGIMMGAIRMDEAALAGGPTTLLNSVPLGSSFLLTVQQGGVLYLKINESPASLADNAGQIQVRVSVP